MVTECVSACTHLQFVQCNLATGYFERIRFDCTLMYCLDCAGAEALTCSPDCYMSNM